MNTENIEAKLKQQAIQNTKKQGIAYTEDPSWISAVSRVIGGICGLLGAIVMVDVFFATKAYSPLTCFIFGIIGGVLLYGLIGTGIVYFILSAIYHSGRIVKKGTVAAAKEGSKLLDNATTAVAKKFTVAVEKGKAEAKIEQEKQKLKEQMNDLELQYLRKCVEELEKKINNKEE